MSDRSKAIIVTGATASGKSQLAHSLCSPNTALINVDSRQVYKHFNIGTAKPSPEEIANFNYKLIDFLSPTESYNAADFYKDALSIICEFPTQKKIFVGGTNFYLDTLTKGISGCTISPKTKTEIERILSENGTEALLEIIKFKDPEYYENFDKNNPRRIERAASVILEYDKSYTSFREERVGTNLDILEIIIVPDRAILYERINQRVIKMVEEGLEGEVKKLLEIYGEAVSPMTSIGYREWIPYFMGVGSLESTIEKIQQNSRHYAKQQLTWYKKRVGSLYIHVSTSKTVSKHDEWLKPFNEIQNVKDIFYNRQLKVNSKLTCRELDADFIRTIIDNFYNQ